ncbi:YD repeat, partial [Trinorchestia longiramus]
PERVILPSGRQYEVIYDDADALRSIMTPTGTAYTFHLTMSIGCYKLKVALPANKVALMLRVNERGRVLSITQPEGGTRLFEYDTLGRLRGEYYGQGYTEYDYWEWGLLHGVKLRYGHDEVRHEFQYHGGLTKEMKLRFRSTKGDLHKVKLHYLYDTSGRLM